MYQHMINSFKSLYPQKLWNTLNYYFRDEIYNLIKRKQYFKIFGMANRFLELIYCLHENNCKIHIECKLFKNYVIHGNGDIVEIIHILTNDKVKCNRYEYRLPRLCELFNELNIDDVIIKI